MPKLKPFKRQVRARIAEPYLYVESENGDRWVPQEIVECFGRSWVVQTVSQGFDRERRTFYTVKCICEKELRARTERVTRAIAN